MAHPNLSPSFPAHPHPPFKTPNNASRPALAAYTPRSPSPTLFAPPHSAYQHFSALRSTHEATLRTDREDAMFQPGYAPID